MEIGCDFGTVRRSQHNFNDVPHITNQQEGRPAIIAGQGASTAVRMTAGAQHLLIAAPGSPAHAKAVPDLGQEVRLGRIGMRALTALRGLPQGRVARASFSFSFSFRLSCCIGRRYGLVASFRRDQVLGSLLNEQPEVRDQGTTKDRRPFMRQHPIHGQAPSDREEQKGRSQKLGSLRDHRSLSGKQRLPSISLEVERSRPTSARLAAPQISFFPLLRLLRFQANPSGRSGYPALSRC